MPVPAAMTLAHVIGGLQKAVGAWAGRGLIGRLLGILLYRRLSEIGLRMERMMARFREGRLAVQPAGMRQAPLDGVDAKAASDAAGAGRLAERALWPRRFAWLVIAAAHEAAGFGLQLRHVLEQPEMVALLKAAPQAMRVLRPLCRALAIETDLLRPGQAPTAPKPARIRAVRVRKPRVPFDWGRIPLPRGVLSAARREGYGKLR